MKNKNIIILVVLLIVAVLVFVFKDKLFKTKTKPVDGSNAESSSGANQSRYMLTYGSKGDEVKLLQAYITEYHSTKLIVDGIWGINTQAAFEKFAKSVEFVASSKGVTATEYKYFSPHYKYLSGKYFTQK